MTNQMRAARGKLTIATVVAVAASLIAIVPASGRGPVPVVYDSGDILVADSGNDAIKTVDPGTGVATPVSSGGSFVFPADVTLDENGDILVVDRDAYDNKGAIIRIDKTTGTQSTVTNNDVSQGAGGKRLLSNPISLDRKGGSVYVTDFHKPPKVIKVNIETGKQSLLSDEKLFHFPGDIVAGGLKKPLVADADEGVIEVNPKTGKLSRLSKGGKFPQGIGLLDDDHVLVADPDRGDVPGAIFEVNVNNGNEEELARGGPLTSPLAVAAADSDTAFVTDTGAPTFPAGGLYEVDLGTGGQTLVNGSSFSNPLGLIVAP